MKSYNLRNSENFKKTGTYSLLVILLSVCLSVAIAFTAFAGETEGESSGGRGDSSGMGASGGGTQSDSDEIVRAALDEAAGLFSTDVYTDPDTGETLEYALYIPEEYSADQEYPLLMFIPDATGSGKSPEEIVSNYYGAAVWATQSEQEKHPSFIFVPAFTGTVTDDYWNTSEQIETAVKIIQYLTKNYSIDTDRLYTTGQSMGCMTSLYLDSKYTDLFAASLFVSGQWDISVLKPLEEQTFFYITSAGDEKASGGQSEVMEMLDADGIQYSYGTWNCMDEDQNEKANELIEEGLNANMIRFEATYDTGSGEQTLGHMQSFNYAYKIEAVRDWLFEQSK